ncbi:MAG TPA: universal stress protein [Gillisia sp.]|nr:universal stress protein [Gillisia sp.]
MNVLILTDFSEVSENAGRYALDFLRKTPSTISLLNIQDINLNIESSEKLGKKMLVISKNMHSAIDNLKAYSTNPKHKFHLNLSLDNLITAVRGCVEEKKIDLIFIGAASKNEHKHPLLGNHAYEIIQKIKCNILAVPDKVQFVNPKRMILPIDYSVLSERKSFQVLRDRNYVKSESLTVLNVNEKENYSLNRKMIQELWESGSNENMDFTSLNKDTFFNTDFLLEIQEKFDVIVILGKNLSISDKLLHSRYGLCSKISNKLPILILHD